MKSAVKSLLHTRSEREPYFHTLKSKENFMPYANTHFTLLLSIPFRFLGINVTSLKKPCNLVFQEPVTLWNRDCYYKC